MKRTTQANNSESSENTPDHFVFIIGAMKSGTTSLFELLSQHPNICPSKVKEPDFFTKDRGARDLQDYLSLWDWKENKHSFALEASVAYTKAPYISDVPRRIHESRLGEFRFIYVLRHPLTRIESQIRHGLFAGWGKSLDSGIPKDAVNFSSYAMQLDKYLEYFSIDTVLLITLEEFTQQPDTVLSRICRFLEIDADFSFLDVSKTRNSGDFFNAPPSVTRITQSDFGQFIVRKVLPARLKNHLRDIIARFHGNTNKPSKLGRWQLTSEERDIILTRLADDLNRLNSEFGVDIGKYWHMQSID